MKRILLGMVLLLLMVTVGCSQEPEQSPQRSGESLPLTLTIKSDKEVYEAGEEIVLEVTLKNNSDKEMIVFWSDENPAGASGGGGTSLTIFPTPPKAYAVYIKPKEAIKKIISPLDSGPTFVLHYVVRYSDRDMFLDFKHKPNQEIFAGTLTSNTITIKVIEKK